ncbi:MAG TPA: rhomboid family intramembrane serine protease [Chitinophagaceae bacterium]|nr:rhomboid family intramembrane serine protease [Chitinophagaceae bacterium]
MNYYRQYRPNVFPPIVKNLLIINVLVFIAQNVIKPETFDITHTFALHDVHSVFFKPHQLITYMFMHGSFEHILFNMLAVWMFGSQLENFWGSKRFLIYYIVTGLGAGLLHLLVLYLEMAPAMEQFRSLPVDMQLDLIRSDRFIINIPTLGASGAVFGLLAAFGYLFPNSLIYVYFLIPLKAKWFVLIYGAIELMLAVRNSAGDNVAHFAHLGGAITGFIIVLIWNKTNRKTLY